MKAGLIDLYLLRQGMKRMTNQLIFIPITLIMILSGGVALAKELMKFPLGFAVFNLSYWFLFVPFFYMGNEVSSQITHGYETELSISNYCVQ